MSSILGFLNNLRFTDYKMAQQKPEYGKREHGFHALAAMEISIF